jgi:hypothetical protein
MPNKSSHNQPVFMISPYVNCLLSMCQLTILFVIWPNGRINKYRVLNNHQYNLFSLTVSIQTFSCSQYCGSQFKISGATDTVGRKFFANLM